MRFIVIGLFLSFSFGALSQSTRQASTQPPRPIYQAAKKNKFTLSGLFKKKDDNVKTGVETQEEFRTRMRALNRQKSKEARQAGKPEYANKFYFGHKRKPKKRPVGKKKYCKICEFAH